MNAQDILIQAGKDVTETKTAHVMFVLHRVWFHLGFCGWSRPMYETCGSSVALLYKQRGWEDVICEVEIVKEQTTLVFWLTEVESDTEVENERE